jgi:hypothetical protein
MTSTLIAAAIACVLSGPLPDAESAKAWIRSSAIRLKGWQPDLNHFTDLMPLTSAKVEALFDAAS